MSKRDQNNSQPGSSTGGGRASNNPRPGPSTGGGRASNNPQPGSSTGGGRASNNPQPESSTGGGRASNNPQPGPSTGGGRASNNPQPGSSTGGGRVSNNPQPGSSTGGGRASNNPQPGSSTGGRRASNSPQRALRRPRPDDPLNEYRPEASRLRLHLEHPPNPLQIQNAPPAQRVPITRFAEPRQNQAPPRYAQANVNAVPRDGLVTQERPGYRPVIWVPNDLRAHVNAVADQPYQAAPIRALTQEERKELEKNYLLREYADLMEYEYAQYVPPGRQGSGNAEPVYDRYVPKQDQIVAMYPPISEAMIEAFRDYLAEAARYEERNAREVPVHQPEEDSCEQFMALDLSMEEDSRKNVDEILLPSSRAGRRKPAKPRKIGANPPCNNFMDAGPSSAFHVPKIGGRRRRRSENFVQLSDQVVLPVIEGDDYPEMNMVRLAEQTAEHTKVNFAFDWRISEIGLEHQFQRWTSIWDLDLLWNMKIELRLNKFILFTVTLLYCYPEDLSITATFSCVNVISFNLLALKFEHPKCKPTPTKRRVALRFLIEEDEPLGFDLIRVNIKVHHKHAENNDGIYESMESMLNSEIHTDVKLMTRGKAMKRHKSVLAARSDVFLKMFEATPRYIYFFDENPDTFKAFIRYLYTGKIDLRKNAAEMKELAFKYQVYDLIPHCNRAILRAQHNNTPFEPDD